MPSPAVAAYAAEVAEAAKGASVAEAAKAAKAAEAAEVAEAASAAEVAEAAGPCRPEDLQRSLDVLIRAAHDPHLIEASHVYQVWNDGEVTIQKSAQLLWRRTLHTVRFPLAGVSHQMPVVYSSAMGTSFAFVEYAAALQIRSLLARAAGVPEEDCVGAIGSVARADPRDFVEHIAAANLRSLAESARGLE